MKADLPFLGLLADSAGNAFNLLEENYNKCQFVLEDVTETRDTPNCGGLQDGLSPSVSPPQVTQAFPVAQYSCWGGGTPDRPAGSPILKTSSENFQSLFDRVFESSLSCPLAPLDKWLEKPLKCRQTGVSVHTHQADLPCHINPQPIRDPVWRGDSSFSCRTACVHDGRVCWVLLVNPVCSLRTRAWLAGSHCPPRPIHLPSVEDMSSPDLGGGEQCASPSPAPQGTSRGASSLKCEAGLPSRGSKWR